MTVLAVFWYLWSPSKELTVVYESWA